MKKILTCLLATLGLSTACGQQNFENADVQGFAELIENPDVVVLDVRTASEYAEGHLVGALHIDQGQSDFMEKAKAALSKDKRVAIYCRSGRRSANAAGKLAAEGYQCVNLKGGILAWKEAGKVVTTDSYEVDVFKTKSGKTVKFHALVHARIRMEYDGKEIEIQLSEKTTVKSEKEVAVTDMADGQIVNGYGKRNDETDVTLDKLVILDKSYGRMALGNISFLNSTLKKTENGWSVETIRNGQQQKTLWPLKLSDKFKVYRRQFGTVDDMQVGMRIVQMTGKAAGELRLVNTIVLGGK